MASANRFVARDRLIEAVWPERGGPDQVGSLQAHVSRLRAVLGPAAITYRAQGYRLCAADIDAEQFEQGVAEGRRLCEAGRTAEGLDALTAALAWWRGDAFEDFRYDHWAQAETRRLTETRWDAVQVRLDAELRLGRHGALVPELEALVAEHPERERYARRPLTCR